MEDLTPFQCSLCYDKYDFERPVIPARQARPAVTLQCGHTYCHPCLFLISDNINCENICPVDRTPFGIAVKDMAPSYSLKEAMLAADALIDAVPAHGPPSDESHSVKVCF